MPHIPHPLRMASYGMLRDIVLPELADAERERYASRGAYLKILADGLMDDPDGAAIYDVSPLVKRLPRGLPLWDYKLDQLVMPIGDSIYIDFGTQDFLKIGEYGLAFDGAYVQQMDNGEATSFMVYLTCADPGFGSNGGWERETYRRLGNAIQIEVTPETTVLEAVQRSFLRQDYWADADIQRDPKVIAAAFDLLARSMLYLGSPDADIEHGRYIQTVGKNLLASRSSTNREGRPQLMCLAQRRADSRRLIPVLPNHINRSHDSVSGSSILGTLIPDRLTMFRIGLMLKKGWREWQDSNLRPPVS